MRCGTSFYNGTLGRQLTLRFWPLIALYSVIWAMSLPFVAITAPNPRTDYWETAETILSNVGYIFQWVTLLLAVGFGLLVAMAVCSHLYSTRSANFTAALPPKRTAMFATHYLTGLLWLVVPFLAMAALAMGIYQLKTLDCLAIFQVFGPGMATGVGLLLFFYSFAVLCGMLTGHLLALPAFYGIFNGLVGGIWTLLTAIFQEFYYGYPGSVATVPAWVSWCTPALHIFRQDRMPDGNYPLVAAIYAGVGVLMALGAWLLYVKRPMERAGDVVIWAGLRPVFRYGVALCSGLALGSLTRAVLNLGPLGLAVSAILWGVAGCFVAQMMLTKSVRVLRYWKGAGAVALTFLVLFSVVKLDLTGYVNRVPDPAQVKSVEVSGLSYLMSGSLADSNGTWDQVVLTSQESITLITQLHQKALDQRNVEESYIEDPYHAQITLTYNLTAAPSIQRQYSFLLSYADRNQPGTLTYDVMQLLNHPDVLKSTYGLDQIQEWEGSGYTLSRATVYGWPTSDGMYNYVELTSTQAQAMIQALLLDIDQGNLHQAPWEGTGRYQISLSWVNQKTANSYIMTIYISDTAIQTINYLNSLGV